MKFFNLVAEAFPFGVGHFQFFGRLFVGVGGLAEFLGVTGDFGFFKVGGDGGLGAFEVRDLFFDGLEFVLQRLEDLVAFVSDGSLYFAAFLGAELRPLGGR